MVAANTDACYVREFDLFRKKLGLSVAGARYATVLENELRSSAQKFEFLWKQNQSPAADEK